MGVGKVRQAWYRSLQIEPCGIEVAKRRFSDQQFGWIELFKVLPKSGGTVGSAMIHVINDHDVSHFQLIMEDRVTASSGVIEVLWVSDTDHGFEVEVLTEEGAFAEHIEDAGRMSGAAGFDQQAMWSCSAEELHQHGFEQVGRFAAEAATGQFLHLDVI